MRWPQATDPQFLDALGVGGLNQAYGTVSGSIASVGSGVWALPGLIAPEAMGVTFNNLVATVTLPSPWGVVTSGGVVVRAHGTQTGADTQSYSVNFSAARPASGSATAYLAATVQQIQQDPFPIPGPPQGFPSFNPNYVPTTGYATNLYTVALTAVTSAPNNTSSFELLRTTLSAGQASISSYSTVGWTLAADRKAFPNSLLGSGGALNPTQLQQIIVPSVAGLTFTLPAVQTAGGLPASFANSTNGNCTVAASGTDRISGISGGNVASITLPPSGGVLMIGNAPQGLWEVIGFNTATNNIWSGTNTFNDPAGQGGPVVQALSAGGAAIKLTHNTSKWMRVINGVWQIVNNAFNTVLASIDDSGNLSVAGGATVTGALNTGGTITASGVLSDVSAGHRLRAVLGAFGSGDLSAATILSDFVFSGNSAAWYTRFPSGFIIQGGSFAANSLTTNITFPLTFTSTVLHLNAIEGNAFSTWQTGVPTLNAFSNSTLTVSGCQMVSLRWTSPPGWVAPSVGQTQAVYWFAMGF